jgi:peptide/nickel transport system substrate-binding protein
MKIMPDAAARLLAFERGEVDFLHWYIVPYDQVARLRKDARFQLIQKGDAAATNGLLLMNHRNEYLKDVRVRRAIAHAINRDDISKKALFGEAKVAKSHVGSSLAWIYTDRFDYAFDPAKANQLLDRRFRGTAAALRIHWASGRDYEGRAAEIIKDNLRAVGIDVSVLVLDRPSFIDKVFRNWDFDLANQLFTTGPDPSISVTPRYHTKQIKKAPFVNGMGYSNPEVDKLMDAEFTEVDRSKRAAMWRSIQQHLMADLPALPLFELPPIHAASANFRDIVTGAQGYIEGRENAYAVR